MEKISGAEILIRELIYHNIEVVFGYPGGAVLNIYDELYKHSKNIRSVLSAHEQGAAHAADGYARTSGKTGVVIATSGPGATNLVTGIANAYLDGAPMVAITGNVATSLLGRDSFQEVDIVGITLPIVKHSYVVRDIKKLQKFIREAFFIANSGRKGPVLIDIPKDIQLEKYEYDSKKTFGFKERVYSTNFDKKLQNKVLETINNSKKPFIYCGGGVVSSNCGKKVLELSKKISAPVGLSMMGMTALPADYPLNLGMVGMHGEYSANMIKNEADLIIALGVRFSDRATGSKPHYRQSKTIIHVDVDEAELDKNIDSNIGICGNIGEFLDTVLPNIYEKKNTSWLKRIEEHKKNQADIFQEESESFNPKNIIQTVNGFTENDMIIATDVGQHQMWVMKYYRFFKERTLLTSGGLGTMGYGLGAAIGGAVATGKKTVLFTGDGSFGMNLNELATAVTENAPLIIIIMNNGVLGMVRQWQRCFYEGRFSNTTLNRKTDFVKLADAFGAEGYRANTLNELKDILNKNFNSKKVVLIDCKIDCDEKALPMIPPSGKYIDMILK